MFKPKSPFQIPKSFSRKNDERKEERKEEKKEMMSIEETKKSPPKQQVKTQHNPKTNHYSMVGGGSQSNGTVDKRFCFNLDTPDPDDDSLYWSYPITSQVTNEVSRKLIMRQNEYFMRGVDESAIASSISIVADDIPGYFNKEGIQTNVVCNLQLADQKPILDDIGIKTYDVLYSQTQDVVWEIPFGVTALKLRVEVDGELLEGDITPLAVLFDIRHIGK